MSREELLELDELDKRIKETQDRLYRLREERRQRFDAITAQIPHYWCGGDPTEVKRYA